MVQRWVLVACLVAGSTGAGGCGDPRAAQREKERRIQEALDSLQRDMDRRLDRDLRSLDPRAITPDPAPDPVAPRRAPKPSCLETDAALTLMVKNGELRACVDADQDDKLDACARWQRGSGKLIGVEPVFDVEASPEPADYHTDTENNDDDRITVTDSVAEICPPDRACLKLMPALPGDQTIDEVATDARYQIAAVVVSGTDVASAHVELWDLQASRLRTKLPIRGLDPDGSYSYSAQVHGSSLVVFAIDDAADSLARGVVYGFDGRPRGALANGSKLLDPERVVEVGGMLAVYEDRADDTPDRIHLHGVATGRPAGTLTLTFDTDAEVELHAVDDAHLVITQWAADKLRVDVIDPRTRATKTYVAPSC